MNIVAMDLHENLVDSAQERLRGAYPDVKALGIACDITKPEELAAALSTIEAYFPNSEIGAVFADAGTLLHKTILKSSIEEWATTLNVNVIGVVNTIEAFLPKAKPAQFFAPQPRWADWFGATAAQHPTRPANMPLYHSLNPCPLKSQADHRK